MTLCNGNSVAAECFNRPPSPERGSRVSPEVAIAAVAAQQFGVFTSQQAKRAGFTARAIRRRCESGKWIVVHRGVYALASAPHCWERNVYAAVISFGPAVAASGPTAAHLLGLTERMPVTVDVAVPARQRRRDRTGIVPHQLALSRSDIKTINGIRTTAPNRTMVDCAGALNDDQLEEALDTALFRGLTSAPALQRYIRQRRLEHRPGVGRLRKMLADRADGTSHSKLERIFIRKLRESGLPMPTRQFQVGGKFIDIAYPDKHVIIELDGAGSRFTASALNSDRRRQNKVVLALRGWTLLRFTWDDVVNHWADVERQIREALS